VRRAAAALYNGCLDLMGAMLGVLLARALAWKLVDFTLASQALAALPFSPGWKLRRAVYARVLPRMGRGSVLHVGVVLDDVRTRIGDDVWVSTGAYVEYADIEDHVLVGPHAVLLAGGRTHHFDRIDVPIKHQGNPERTPLRIGVGAWIGANATVLAEVGAHAVVGAGAVVTKPVPAYAIVGGNPARLIRMRSEGPPTA
jgi:carbonic anhydrase/acetyltransferase-like protein (isoleucine patch superfamily)